METDATPHPMPAPSDTLGGRAGGHLQLVVDRVPAPGPDDGCERPATAPVELEPDPSEAWSQEHILGLLDAFHSSDWGACLSPNAAGAINGVLLTSGLHAFRGVAGLPFLADCLRADVLDRALVEQTTEVQRMVPTALRQFVRFVDRLGTGTLSEITLAKLEYIDRVEPAWQEAVTGHARRARVDELRLVDQLHELAADVGATLLTDPGLLIGDAEVLFDSIWTDALPDEPVQLHGLDADTALRVLEVGGWTDHFFRNQTQEELRSAARRLLERVARTSPMALRRARAQSIAAGLCYAVIHGNVSWIAPRDWLGTSHLARQLGVDASGIPARARALLAATGVDQPLVAPVTSGKVRRLRLGDPAMLVTSRRQDIVLHAGSIIRQLTDAGM